MALSATLLVACQVTGCAHDPIDWSQPEIAQAPGAPGPGIPAPPTVPQCAGSARVAGDSAIGWYAAWWAPRPDSTADLVVARSADGQQWSPPVHVDTTDVGRTGCRRLPPSIAADGANVHVAYAMAAAEAPGIFASHSMDRGALFHSPVAIVYGERPGLTAIASRGDLVAIAYEDPNSTPARIGLALSRTMAHGFEWRGLVSQPVGPARSPAISLDSGSITVSWLRGEGKDAVRLVRRGTLR